MRHPSNRPGGALRARGLPPHDGVMGSATVAGIAAAIAALLMVGCGIPEFAFLDPPTLGAVTDLPPTVTFVHSTRNDTDSFAGYELYYKFYEPDTGEGQFQTDRTAIENASPGAVASTIAGRGYLRTHRRIEDDRTSDRKPVLNVPPTDRGIPFTVTIALQQTGQTGAVASWTAAEPRQVELVRNQSTLGNPTSPVGFTEVEFEAGHADLAGLELDDRGLMMGLVIASYGIDFATGSFGELYSQAIVAEKPLRMFFQ